MSVKKVFCAVFVCSVLFSGTCFAGDPCISDPTTLDALGRTVEEGYLISFDFSSTAFTDPDGDILQYRAEVGGQDISSGYWLTFIPGTRTFYGTVPAGYAGRNIYVTVHACDDPLPDDTEAVYTFVISVTGEPVITDVTYTYDDLNRLTGADYGDGSHIGYSYDSAGNRTQKICYAP
jgi:YD repeat-containing protein